MLKKLAASMFLLSLAAYGCSSSSGSPRDGSTGAGGTTDAAHEGGGGNDGSSDGSSATDVALTSDASKMAADMCDQMLTNMDGGHSAVAYSGADYCALLFDTCMPTATDGIQFTSMATCVDWYDGTADAGVLAASAEQQKCLSYHVCAAFTNKSPGTATHCMHAEAKAVCTQ
jgi:hypothetical protein